MLINWYIESKLSFKLNSIKTVMSLSRFFVVTRPSISKLVSRHAVSCLSTSASTLDMDICDHGRQHDEDVYGDYKSILVPPIQAMSMMRYGGGISYPREDMEDGVMQRNDSAILPPDRFDSTYSRSNHEDETMFCLLMEESDEEVIALKKGPPLSDISRKAFNPDDVSMMTPFGEWKPPVPPQELMDTANYKILQDLWKHVSDNVEMLDRERRVLQSTVGNTHPSLPDTAVEMIRAARAAEPDPYNLVLDENDYEKYLRAFTLAIRYQFHNQMGRDGLYNFTDNVVNVCQKFYKAKMERIGKSCDLKASNSNLGGGCRGGRFNSSYAYRIEHDYRVQDTSDEEFMEACRKPEMWSLKNEKLGRFKFSYKEPDIMIEGSKKNLKSGEDGLLVGEVMSDSEISDDSKWQIGINQATIKAMRGVVLYGHSAAVVVSPTNGAFMSFDIQDGFIKRKQKMYTLGSTDRNHMFADAWMELFHDLVGYTWYRFYT